MKKRIFIFSLIFLILLLKIGYAETIVGKTQVEKPFSSNQRAICRDAKGYIHVVWLYNDTTIRYARSKDNGLTWEKFYLSSNLEEKSTPHISCDGNNITVFYLSSDKLMVGISEDNGDNWLFRNPRTSSCMRDVTGEREGGKIYIIYSTYVTSSCGYGDVIFFNSSDSGKSWGEDKILFDGFRERAGGLISYNYFYEPTADANSSYIFVCARSEKYLPFDSGVWTYSLKCIKSENSGETWSADMSIAVAEGSGNFPPSDEFYYPSVVLNGNNIYITYYSKSKRVYFNSSDDYGATWSGERIDTITDSSKASYPSVGIDPEGYPVVFWQQNDTTNNKVWDIVARKYDGVNWIPEGVHYITDDQDIEDTYVNVNPRNDGTIDFVWKRGDNITYSHITTFFTGITLNSANYTFKVISPIEPKEIKLVGDRKYLNIFWTAVYLQQWRKEIAVKCYLNCPNPGDDIESNCASYQSCNSTTISGSQGVCTILNPNYNFTDINKIACKIYDPFFPEIEYKLSLTFRALNFTSFPLKNISATVGDSITLPISIKNLGLLEDNYTINITPLSNPSFISIKNNSIAVRNVKNKEIGIGYAEIIPLSSSEIELGIWVYSDSPEWFDCSACPPNFVCEPASQKCSKHFVIKIESGYSSLNEIGLAEIILLIFVALVLIYRKGP